MAIGRRPSTQGIFILEGSISREHAEVYFDEDVGAWFVRDLDSKNGTLVNDEVVTAPSLLRSGDIVFFGQVGFLFLMPIDGEFDASFDSPLASETLRADQGIRAPTPAEDGQTARHPLGPAGEATEMSEDSDDDEITQVGLPHLAMRLIEPSGGGGGFLETSDKRVQLTATQFAFLQILTLRMKGERSQPEAVRGFIRSSELLAELPWDTPHPEENHLKQLVRRVRRSLTRAGLGNMVESRRGFGYRLRVTPSEVDAT
ncbi:FHA domain-containing protein [Haliangium ochraceum]|uniref:FHA domain-containing protein n=1 Tax=Haliangium ochraceum TaxID=80816 RepID=UPI00019BA743|nr:FHA domain-containing protein [Haliangium ochraceum]